MYQCSILPSIVNQSSPPRDVCSGAEGASPPPAAPVQMLSTSETFQSTLESGTGSSGTAEQESRHRPAESDLGNATNDIGDVLRVEMTLKDIREP